MRELRRGAARNPRYDLRRGHLHRWMITMISGKRVRLCLLCNAEEKA